MSRNKQHYLHLDPRTKILLLLISNILLFLGSSAEVIYPYMAILAIMLLLSGCYRSILAFFVIGTILISMIFFIFPIAPGVVVILFTLSVNYTFKMLPCLMAGALLIETTSLHEVILAMRKFSLPQRLIIPISVTIRYFPAIVEETRHIHNAMKLRKIPLSLKMECFIVPFMMAASTAVEELSAAAVTRGIENPTKKTSLVQLHYTPLDYLVFIMGASFTAASLVL